MSEPLADLRFNLTAIRNWARGTSPTVLGLCDGYDKLYDRAAAAEAELETLRAQNTKLRGAVINARGVAINGVPYGDMNPLDLIIEVCDTALAAALSSDGSDDA